MRARVGTREPDFALPGTDDGLSWNEFVDVDLHRRFCILVGAALAPDTDLNLRDCRADREHHDSKNGARAWLGSMDVPYAVTLRFTNLSARFRVAFLGFRSCRFTNLATRSFRFVRADKEHKPGSMSGTYILCQPDHPLRTIE